MNVDIEWLESVISNSETFLTWVRSPGNTLVVWRGGKELVELLLVLSRKDGWKVPAYITRILL